MARIRTIKPEFPQSETIGRLSRDARLLFILLWTLADDAGRLRGASRALASLLYPYDDDAPRLIEGWLAELDGAGTIRRYMVDGSTYLDIPNWLKHQKIDKPSTSKMPAFDEGSRIFVEPSRNVVGGSGPGPGPGPKEEDHSDLRSDATASRDLVPVDPEFDHDPRKALFGRGLKTLARITGKTPDSCRSLVGRWLKQAQDEAIHVLAAIDDAERNSVADPTAWISAVLKSRPAAGQQNLSGWAALHERLVGEGA